MFSLGRFINAKFIDATLIFLQALYLIRYPLLVLLLIAAFMPVTLWFSLKTLLANLYDLDSFLKTFWFSLSAFLLAYSAISTLKLILLYGGERIEFDQATRETLSRRSTKYALSSISFLVAFILTSFLISGVFFFSVENIWTKIAGCLAGFAASMVLLFFADILQRLINRKGNAESLDRFLFPLPNPFAGWANRSERLYRLSNSIFRPAFLEPYFKTVPGFLGRGYLRYKDDGTVDLDADGRTILNPGHFTAIALFSFFFVVYVIVGWSSYLFPWLTRGALEVTAISYIMLLLTVLVWALTALSFLLDRYRFPVLLVVVPVYLLASLTSQDYVFEVEHLSAPSASDPRSAPLTPADVLDATPASVNGSAEEYAIVVAANGGGIQASAWTAKVLTGIEQKCRDGRFGPAFQGCAPKIRLISSVSGGSVGAMYFIESYKDGGLLGDSLDKIVADASESSLDAAAWGLVYPDFTRSVIPFYPWSYGRGHALEDAWSKDDSNLKKGLLRWREGVRKGWRPASIFNATVVETGERMMISTSDLCEKRGPLDECSQRADKLISASPGLAVQPINAPYGRTSFYSFLDGYDIPIVTAVRLSASFPYVTPAPRADIALGESKNYKHLADGGYYDNYGVSSLLEWLNEGLSYKTKPNLKNVLIIQIRGDRVINGKTDVASSKPYYQSLAPLYTLLNVRTTGQLSRNDAEMEIFMRYWRTRGINIQTVIFEFPRTDNEEAPPLSWHLSDAQKTRIDEAWNDISNETDENKAWNAFTSFIEARNKAVSQ